MIESGIYQLRNIINNHIYIGSAFVLLERKDKHYYAYKHNKCNRKLQNAFNKYKFKHAA
jgi:hypothetical protein